MKVIKKLGGGVGFARKKEYEYENVKYEADIKDGDIVKILDAGAIESNINYPGESNNFKIKTRNGEKKVGFNQKTTNVLIDEFGDETEKWINEDVRVIIWKTTIGGKKVDVAYFVTEDWNLDDYGELTKKIQVETKDIETKEKIDKEEYPEENINTEDIPF